MPRPDGPSEAQCPPRFMVGPGMYLSVRYRVFDAEGEVVGGEEQAHVVFGLGSLLPTVEAALSGLYPGDTREVVIRARDAYGARDPNLTVDFERADFPDDVVPGDHLELEDRDGHVLVVRVLEVDQERVRLDMNHPLAGQDLRVELQVAAVRPATKEEIDFAMEMAEKPTEEDETGTEGESTGLLSPKVAGLIPSQRLLPPRHRR